MTTFTAPVLSHIGAVEQSTTFGTTMYEIDFDATMTNVLMFEYKTKENGAADIPANITLGYVNIDQAAFQKAATPSVWQIPIPSVNNDYNPSTAVDIQVRVYNGVTGGTEIGTSPWSNTLAVYAAPPTPVVESAFYDAVGTNDDDLYVFMTPDANIDYTEVNFIVAYYFNGGGSTTWTVSAVTAATEVSYNGNTQRMVQLSNFGDVTSGSVYAAVYAVFEYTVDATKHYSVSAISNTATAGAASEYSTPTLAAVSYQVYVNQSQDMNLSWTAPDNSNVPTYTVDYYQVEKSIDGGSNWSSVDNNVSSTTKTYDATSNTCGQTLSFRVRAVSTNGTYSDWSSTQTKSVFQYSGVPTSLTVVDGSASNSGGEVTLSVSFENPSDIGCGAGDVFVVTLDDGTTTSSAEEAYDSGASSYTVAFTGVTIGTTGSFTVYLKTEDTNGGSLNNGATATGYYNATNFVMADIIYNVYTDTVTETMSMSWTDLEVDSWTISTVYSVSDAVDGSIGTTTGTTFGYDVSGLACGKEVNVSTTVTISRGGTSYTVTSNSVTQNVFRYSGVPTSLTQVDGSASNSGGNITLSVSFGNPISIGCGTGDVFVITLDDGTTTSSAEEAYDSGASSYTVAFTGVTLENTGTFTVYLKTNDTNGGGLKNSATATGYYNATNFVLDAITYNIYTDKTTDTMDLAWNSMATGSWTVDSTYAVNDAGVGALSTTTASTAYTYDTSGLNYNDEVNVSVTVTISRDGTSYTVTSNSVTKNVFRYASAPASMAVDWAIATGSNLDIRVNFGDATIETGATATFYVSKAYNDSDVLLGTVSDTAYVGSSTYDVSFDDITTAATGYVVTYLLTTDTNGGGSLEGVYSSQVPFTRTSLPLFRNVASTDVNSNITFEVVTQVALDATAEIVWITGGALSSIAISTQVGTAGGVTVTKTTQPASEILYSFTVAPTTLGGTAFATHQTFMVANDVGLSNQIVSFA